MSDTTNQPIPNTIAAGLSTWSDPIGAIGNITSGAAFTLLGIPGYENFALGALLPGAAILILTFSLIAGSTGSTSGRRR